MALLLGLDAGTSSVKALLVREDGAVAGSGVAEVQTRRPAPGLSEQDPGEIWDACVEAVRQARVQVPGEPVAAIGLSAQRAGVLCADQAGVPLAPLITWQDNRHSTQARRLASGEYGLRPQPGLASASLARLLWLRENRPDFLDAAAAVCCTIKDWLVWRLAGTPATDHASVSISGLYDVAVRGWDERALAICGLRAGQMSRVTGATEPAGELGEAAATALGLGPGIPVATGSGDGEASSIGLGATRAGTYGGSIGTVSAIRALLADLPGERSGWPALYATHLHPLGWLLTGTLPTGGAALAWLRGLLGNGSLSELERAAGTVAEGPGDLLFIPHMAGMRTPRHVPDARGVLFGLGLHHGPGHLARAVMEGVAFAMAEVVEGLAQVAPPAQELRIGGGGARSDLWLGILAAVTGVPVVRTAVPDASALGAAMCGAVVAGMYPSLSEASALARVARRFSASGSEQAAYRQAREAYTGLLADIEPHFAALRSLHAAGVEPSP